MHAVMMTSTPALRYLTAAGVEVMGRVRSWRGEGLPVCSTVDAGPNVHIICPETHMREVADRARSVPGVTDVLTAPVGGPARLLPNDPTA
jgi:diphosphomevalonate decarboxylase